MIIIAWTYHSNGSGQVYASMKHFLLFIFISLAVLFIYFYFRSSRSQTYTSAVDAPHSLPSPPRFPPPDSGEPGMRLLDNLKEQIRTGIVTLFPRPEANNSEHPRIPFAYDEVDHKLLEQAKQNIESIHNFRSVHSRLRQIMNDPAVNIISSLSSVIIADPVLSGKVLKIVNSAYYGRTEKVNSIGHAVILLGIVQLREILYREGMLGMLKTNDPAKDALIEALWRHATITSICAANLRSLFPGLDQGTLFTSGLIHDIGKIILVRMANNPEYTIHSTIHDEDRIFGINHVVTGMIALEQWDFSDFMRSVLANHHSPTFLPLGSAKMSQQAAQHLTVLFLANQLAKMVHPSQNYLSVDPLHPSYHPLIEPDIFLQAVLDNTFLYRISKSEAFITECS